MNQRRCRFAFVLAVAGTLSLGALASRAGELPDPTRPPAALRPQAATSPSSAMTPSAPVFVLQSVLVGDGRAPSAIINGRVVEVGAAIDGHRLLRVSDRGVQLAGPKGTTTTVALTPASEKVAAAPAIAPQPLVAMTKASRHGDAGVAALRTGDTK